MFLHFDGISYSRFRRLKEHYELHSIFPRTHRNTNRLPENTLPYSTIEDVQAFLLNYVEENAITLPGRIPGFKSDDVKVLSSSETKIKKVFKVTHISIYEFAKLVDTSSSVEMNKAQLVATHNGRVIVPVYDWASFLGRYFKKIANIKSFHHFRFLKGKPGMVYCKEHVSTPEQSFMLLKNAACIPPVSFPPRIEPDGLSNERRSYLYREIRPFCKAGTKDIVAPAP